LTARVLAIEMLRLAEALIRGRQQQQQQQQQQQHRSNNKKKKR